jgi:hypothetical protein
MRIKAFVSDHPLGSIFICALLIRVLNIWHVAVLGGKFVIEDSFFLTFSIEWAQSFGFMAGEPGSNSFVERVPMYPLVVALFQAIGLGVPIILALFNGVLDALTCVIICLLGCMMDRRLGLVAGVVAAMWPNLIIHSGLVLSDALFVLLFSAMLYGAARFLREPTTGWSLASGSLLGFAIVTRTVAHFLVPPITIAVGAIALYHRRSKLTAAGLSLIFVVGAMIATVPVLTHNWLKFDNFSFSMQSGIHMAYWVVPPIKAVENGTPLADTVSQMRGRFEDGLKRDGVRETEISPFDVDRRLKEIAIAEILGSSPIAMAKAWAKGMMVNLMSPAILIDTRVRALATQSFYSLEAPNFVAKVWRYVAGNGPVYGFLFVIGALGSIVTLGLSSYGALLLWRRNYWVAVFAGLAVVYFLLLNGPVGSPKYRLPLEPIMVLLTSFGGLGLWDWWQARYSKKRES